MHELSLCQQLAAVVRRAATGLRVLKVEVEVGELRQVVPEALAYAWDFVIRGSDLAGAELSIRSVAALLACRECGAQTTWERGAAFGCRQCGSAQTAVIAGEEFRVVALEVVPAQRGVRDGALSPSRR